MQVLENDKYKHIDGVFHGINQTVLANFVFSHITTLPPSERVLKCST